MSKIFAHLSTGDDTRHQRVPVDQDDYAMLKAIAKKINVDGWKSVHDNRNCRAVLSLYFKQLPARGDITATLIFIENEK
jgi:hypothetical protein